MKRHLQVLTIAALGGTLLGCISESSDNDDTPTPPTLSSAQKSDLVALEKNYVPALFYSNLTAASELHTGDAINTLERTTANWDGLKTTNANTLNWASYFTEVDTSLATASTAYTTITSTAVYPADLSAAHNALETVRDSWSTMRTSNNISYFFDNVTTAHHAMGPVGMAAGVYTQSAQSALDLATLQVALLDAVPSFSNSWNSLTTAYGNGSAVSTLYNLSSDKSTNLTANISNADPTAPGMTQMIGKLSGAMNSCNAVTTTFDPTTYDPATYDPTTADPCEIMVFVSSKIKPKFVQVFLTFGDFVNPFMDDIIASNKAMIPALYCTGNPPDATPTCGDLAGTLNYVMAFAGAMQTFGAHLQVSPTMNATGPLGWGPSMQEAQTNLESAIGILSIAPDLATAKANGAHLAIEAVRSSMHYICATYENHVTLMTRSNEYHTEFEKILAVALDPLTGAPKTSLTEAEVATIDGYMAALQTALTNMSAQAELEDTAWGLENGSLTAVLAAQAVSVSDLLATLAAYNVVTNDNSADIAIKSLELKKKYIPFFKMIGAFALAV